MAAVPTGPEGRPCKAKPVPVRGFRNRGSARGTKRRPAPDAEVVTDAPGHAGRNHRAIRTGSGRGAAQMAPFKRVNTSLGNIGSAITGTYRKLGPNHAERHLASFAWCYNRRYHHHPFPTMIPRFLHSAARTRLIPYHVLIAG